MSLLSPLHTCGALVRAAALASIATAMLSSAAGCAGAPRTAPVQMGPVETGPNTIEYARKFLEGRWTLISYQVFPPGRPAIEVTGGSGTLLYDAFGNLDMQIRVSDEATAEGLERAGVPLQEGVIATAGRTIINLQDHTLSFLLEGEGPLLLGPPSGPLALSRPRHWEVNGRVLTLTTNGDDGRPVSVGRWEKQ